jgi:hypothetical protein
MNKIFFVLAIACLMALLPTDAFADSADTEIFATYADEAPAIDGILAQDEWEGSVEYTLDEFFAAECEGGEGPVVMKFSFMWNEEGLYMYCTANDATSAPPIGAGNPLNETDAFQIGINPTNKKGDLISDAYFFDFVPKSGEEYPAGWYEHFVYFGAPEGTGIEVAGAREGAEFQVEAFLPWEALRYKGEDFTVDEGLKMSAAVTYVDFDEKGKQLTIYKTWKGWTINNYNSLVLCPIDWQVSAEYGVEERSFAEKKSEEITKTGDGTADTPKDAEAGTDEISVEQPQEQGISLIVFVFTAILLGVVLIVINIWRERSNEK